MKNNISTPVAASIIVLVLFLIALGVYIHSRSSSGPTKVYTQGGQPWLTDSKQPVMPSATR